MWRAVTDAVGAEARDALWAHPDMLPTAADIDDPAALVARLTGAERRAEADDEFDQAPCRSCSRRVAGERPKRTARLRRPAGPVALGATAVHACGRIPTAFRRFAACSRHGPAHRPGTPPRLAHALRAAARRAELRLVLRDPGAPETGLIAALRHGASLSTLRTDRRGARRRPRRGRASARAARAAFDDATDVPRPAPTGPRRGSWSTPIASSPACCSRTSPRSATTRSGSTTSIPTTHSPTSPSRSSPRLGDPAGRPRLPGCAATCPHLAVVSANAASTVGPFVEPGLGPCLHCVELDAPGCRPGAGPRSRRSSLGPARARTPDTVRRSTRPRLRHPPLADHRASRAGAAPRRRASLTLAARRCRRFAQRAHLAAAPRVPVRSSARKRLGSRS